MGDVAGVVDPHAPITNVPVEEESEGAVQLSPPVPGRAEPIEPNGVVESIAGLRREAAGELLAPDAVLPDIGVASFGGEMQMETVHGADDRVAVSDTARYPWSSMASLLITARDGSQWIGTGWFIAPHVLATAGHCVYINNSPVAARNGWVLSIQVMPGRNRTALPFGAVTANRFWTVHGWANGGDQNYDYAAIVVPTPIGDTVGTLGFGVFPDEELAERVVNIAGYPGDKEPGTLWYDARAVAALAPSKVHYDLDTAGGQSGAAVYVIDEDGRRIGVGVHAYGGPTTNSGTRISPPVFKNLSDWKA
ncbi:V8-like Glu-specific endopeptidase [Actinoplanes tereljensis]|uniref:Serine protease n=1 Tax=Paractinoplanes tereljensis TaxID=571912 RepID=A0A919NQS3_9ACTN|nr:trypsin-like peptidase domain-containing protein [Actinoplanes tereljensis]GIF22618.1 hypothetical protein Ate02nite_53480 [Actinoplanes tereljensis]